MEPFQINYDFQRLIFLWNYLHFEFGVNLYIYVRHKTVLNVSFNVSLA